MRTPRLIILTVGLAFLGPGVFDTGGGMAALAQEGEGGRDLDIKLPSQANAAPKQNKPAKETDKARKQRIEQGLSLVKANIRELNYWSKEDNLLTPATDLARIRALQWNIDGAFEKLRGTKYRNEPNKSYQLLTKWRNDKSRKVRAYYARVILSGIAAVREMDKTEKLAEQYQEAKKKGEDLKAALIKGEYREQRSRYYEKVRQVPKDMRDRLFEKFPKDPAKVKLE